MGTAVFFPEIKRLEFEVTTYLHVVPRSRMRGAIPTLQKYVFMAWRLVKHRENFTLPLPSVSEAAYKMTIHQV
jgi:hypothetical protein